MKKATTVSLCMITKNEEELILSCINSAKHLVDEIIVVDTGSGDQTAHMAGESGARVFHFDWTGDFARARNFALEQAVSDWILVLDADEVLDPVSAEEFRKLLLVPGIEGYFLTVDNYLDTGREVIHDRVVRLFRNNHAYRFEGAIHEQVTASILKANSGQGLAIAPLVIKHYGYLKSQLSKKNKANRNMSIINKELKSAPHNPFLLYCLAVEHYQQGSLSEGLTALEKALLYMRGTEGYFEDVVVNTALGLFTLGEFKKVNSFISKSIEMLPDQPDLLLLRGLGCLGLQSYHDAAGDLEKALQTKGGKILPDYRVLCFLGDACNLSGNYTRAEEAYLSALHQSSKFLYPMTQLLGLIQRGQNTVTFEQISRFTSTRKKRAMGQELLAAGDTPLAAVILLFALYDLTAVHEPDEDPVWLCKEFTAALSRLNPVSGRNVSLSYATVTSSEILAYALTMAKGCDCSIFPARRKLKFLIEKALLLLITEFYPHSYPQPITCDFLNN